VPLQMTDQTPSAGLLTVHREGDMDAPFAIIINLPQSLGSREAKKLVRELKMQITDEPPLVIVDLSRVTKMDCAGLDGLLVCMQEIAKHDGAIQVRAISPAAATFWNCSNGPAVRQIRVVAGASSGFCCCPSHHCRRRDT
jgi:anti-anti-sigma regulatory factor